MVKNLSIAQDYMLVLLGERWKIVATSKEHTVCPLGMGFWTEAVVADVWRSVLSSFQGALLQSDFVDWYHGVAHWDSLKLPVSGFSFDGTSTPCTPGAFVLCWVAKLCTSIILVNILGCVGDCVPCYFQGCQVRTFKGSNCEETQTKSYEATSRSSVLKNLTKQLHEGKGTWDGFPLDRALPQCLWGVHVGQARAGNERSFLSIAIIWPSKTPCNKYYFRIGIQGAGSEQRKSLTLIKQ